MTITNPGNRGSLLGKAASLQLQATDSAPGQAFTYTALGLPPDCRSAGQASSPAPPRPSAASP